MAAVRARRAPLHPVAPTGPAPLPAGALQLLRRAGAGLQEAAAAGEPAERFVVAHLAALRAGAAVVTARQVPGVRRRGPVNVWESLAALAPELEAWARFFGVAAERRAAVESGRGAAVGEAEAEAHLGQAEAFTALVAEVLAVPVHLGGLPLAAS